MGMSLLDHTFVDMAQCDVIVMMMVIICSRTLECKGKQQYEGGKQWKYQRYRRMRVEGTGVELNQTHWSLPEETEIAVSFGY
jgi:hypothetical protein